MKNNLTILIPSYKRRNRLVEVIDNILSLKINANIIVLFDSLNDENFEILRKRNIYNIELHEHENKGLSATRNNLIKLSKTEWSFFLDDDDDITKEFAEYINKNIDKLTNDVYRFSKLIVKDGVIKYDRTPKINKNKLFTSLQVSTYLFKTSFLKEKIRFQEGVLSEDIFLAVDAFSADQITIDIPSIKYYVLNQDSITKKIKWEDYERTIIRAKELSITDKKYLAVMFVAFFIGYKRFGVVRKSDFKSIYNKYFSKRRLIFASLPSVYRIRFMYCYIISLLWRKH